MYGLKLSESTEQSPRIEIGDAKGTEYVSTRDNLKETHHFIQSYYACRYRNRSTRHRHTTSQRVSVDAPPGTACDH